MSENKHLIWIGCGEANFPILDYDDFKSITFIDARVEPLELLKAKFSNRSKCNYLQMIISEEPGNHKFRYVSLRPLSQIGDLQEIEKKYPSLNVDKSITGKGHPVGSTIDNVLKDDELGTIILDIPNISDKLLLDLEKTRLSKNITYCLIAENSTLISSGMRTKGTDFNKVDSLISTENIKYLCYTHDIDKEKLRSEIKKLKQDQERLKREHEVSEKCLKQISTIKNINEKSLALLRSFPFELKKVSNNTNRQIESFISLQGYLNEDILPLAFHGWPISPDVGLVLADYIKSYQVDTIIEFGSGTSTILLSKCFVKANPKKSEWKLNRPIVSFEHNQHYHKLTKAKLVEHGCSEIVDLELSKLKYINADDGENYSYYDCENSLANISESLNQNKSTILILVDGPPGSTNKNARYPALELLLKYFNKQKMILVMDDYSRPDELETFNKWKDVISNKGLPFEERVIEAEKGLAILEIN